MADLDFPLILVNAVLISGAIWLLDIFWLAPRRKQAQQQYLDSVKQVDDEQLNALTKEPVYVEYSKSFFPVLFIVLVLRSFLFEPFQIPSGSMLPTLKIGDFILVNKYSYGLRLPVLGTKVVPIDDPARGDVMVFKFPKNPKINFIKRVVGLPGDRIRYQNKQFIINGEPMPQELLARIPPAQPQQLLMQENLDGVEHQIYKNVGQTLGSGEWVVPEGHYFMVGDNRDNSNDSRFWGFVPDELVVGKAVVVWMHWDSFWSIPSFAHVGAID